MKALNELAEKFSAAADADKASRYKQETNQSEQTEQGVETEKEQKNNAAKGVKHSVDDRYDYSKSFEEQIDDYKKGLFPKIDTLIVRDTPKVFKDIGLLLLPMTYTQKHLQEAIENKDGDHLGENLIKKLPEALENPIAIIDSVSKPGRLVAIIEIKGHDRNVLSAVEVEGAVASEALEQGGIYYWQKNKAIQLMKSRGVQFPKFNIGDGFIKSISHPLSKVNKKINSHTETKQFIKWFGDWKNKPKNASKIVDNKGDPMIVYHQTGNKFNVFDTNKQGAGEFDDETPNGIFLKPLPNDIGLKRATKP